MQKKIEKIKELAGPWMESIFYSPVSDQQIKDFEMKKNIEIPKSYKEFLNNTNGAKIFGGDAFFYGIGDSIDFEVNYDFSEGKVPKQLLIVGFYRSRHVCYDYRYKSFIFYEYEEYDEIEEECMSFSTFDEVLDYIIDIAIS